MDNPQIERARHHVEGGKRIIAAQERLIAEMKAKGEDTTIAESLLDSFRRTQASFEDGLRRLLGEGD